MHKEILTDEQQQLLHLIGQSELSDRFYLTGGTALAAFYLGHRYSEDIDLFSQREIDPLVIAGFLENNKDELGITSIESQTSYNRNIYFLLLADGISLKTEFTYFPFEPIEQGTVSEYSVRLDSIQDIAVNKLFTIHQKPRARDFVDLYFIAHHEGYDGEYELTKLIEQAKAKFDWHIDPLNLSAQLRRVDEVKDYPRMIADLDRDKLIAFFRSEAETLKDDILE